ncbi:MAG: sigma-70 family RNA polymerase sigma factor [Planctomycetota bacterium]
MCEHKKCGLPAPTTVIVANAVAGDMDAIGLLSLHFNPLLKAQAERYLRTGPPGLCDPEDLIQYVWQIVLSKVQSWEDEAARRTPAFVSFLTRTLRFGYQSQLGRWRSGAGKGAGTPLPSNIEAANPSPSSPARRLEKVGSLVEAIESLTVEESTLFVDRGLDRVPFSVIAATNGVTANALRKQYQRILERLRDFLPPDLIDDFEQS